MRILRRHYQYLFFLTSYHIIAKIKFPHSKTVFIYGVFTYTKDVREPAATYYAGSLDLNKGKIKYTGARE